MLEELKIKEFGGEIVSSVIGNSNNVFIDYLKGYKKQLIFISSINDKNFQTDLMLEKICCLLKEGGKFGDIKLIIFDIRAYYLSVINDLFLLNNKDEDEKLISLIDSYFEKLLFDIFVWFKAVDKIYPSLENNFSINTTRGLVSIKQSFELIMSYIYKYSINTTGINSEVVKFDGDILDHEGKLNEGFLIGLFSARISNKILAVLNDNQVVIFQGNIPNLSPNLNTSEIKTHDIVLKVLSKNMIGN
ncbi:MAG: hypothetical protein PHH98_00740 [Candidatus Gracilibacteria bacterium]|nr:hypothetical protein [Candidatus Gracilibacteria bacterium]